LINKKRSRAPSERGKKPSTGNKEEITGQQYSRSIEPSEKKKLKGGKGRSLCGGRS